MQDDYGTEIIAIEEPPNNGQISISSSLNQLGKPFLLDRKIGLNLRKLEDHTLNLAFSRNKVLFELRV